MEADTPKTPQAAQPEAQELPAPSIASHGEFERMADLVVAINRSATNGAALGLVAEFRLTTINDDRARCAAGRDAYARAAIAQERERWTTLLAKERELRNNLGHAAEVALPWVANFPAIDGDPAKKKLDLAVIRAALKADSQGGAK